MSASNTRRRRYSALRKAQRAVNSSQARGQKRRTRVRRREVGPAIKTVYRTSRLLRTDTRVRYGGDVAARSVDREAWANVVAQLINQETSGNKTRFAQLVGVTYKSVLRWINQQTDVSEESVRQVARAVGVKPGELLVRVGYYAPDEMSAAEEPKPATGRDPALDKILAAPVSNRRKRMMIQRLAEIRAAQATREMDEVQWWLDQSEGA